MSAESLLVSVLQKDEVIGSIVGGRIYDTYMPEAKPHNLYPCATYTCVERPHVRELRGNEKTYYPRYQIAFWSLRSSDLRQLVQRLKDMEGQRAEADGNTQLMWMFVGDEQASAEPTQQMDERAARSATIDITLWYKTTGS